MLSRFSPRLASAAVRRFSAAPGAVPGSALPTAFDIFNPTEDHTMFRNMLRQFAEDKVEPQALEHNRKEIFNRDLFTELGGLGVLGITVAEEYGGSAMDATAVVIAMEELSASDPAFCLSYLAHATLFVNNLHLNGTHAQKLKYLPSACDGSKVGGMCMSEPGAGTDVLGMSTTAKQQEGGDWLINGTKMWITNGTLDGETTGDYFLVYARTGEKKTDLSMFIVEKDMPGFSLGQKIENKLGMRASMTAELVFEDVRVPAENLVGTVNGASICMMRNLEIERVALAAMATGIARRCVEEMNKYATARKAFGKPLSDFGQTQKAIGESYADYMAGKSYTYSTSNNLDLASSGNVLDSDGVKLFAAKMSKEVADRAIQVLGGNGYTGEYRVEQMWRDAKLLEIGGGTNEAHHKNMVNWFKKAGHELP
ncbi:hypothetical protein TeGR_g9531 [Tetraparma gracilis]|uniref:Isovaleryl-CoA dehydrogenase n=1 Tax=Tetraparma gracilis TaxID=2962635 RepID=A0ABQ6N990_9STRA|nr:hypothetical protein TeGR_g9531 [Tetraparma gracilis]